MPALVAGIQVFFAELQQARRGWPGTTSPGMTLEQWFNMTNLAMWATCEDRDSLFE
jgi:hypothetical protein